MTHRTHRTPIQNDLVCHGSCLPPFRHTRWDINAGNGDGDLLQRAEDGGKGLPHSSLEAEAKYGIYHQAVDLINECSLPSNETTRMWVSVLQKGAGRKVLQLNAIRDLFMLLYYLFNSRGINL